ncbi:nicotinamide mononucleotide transporter [Flavobacterium noncentrifugens]|uniref:Nicotinamide riboside transporter PnuC n=1 Tax=Flavobacterium noncentrifugens TaxID=1128970 RepID=A0A1G8S5R8_9FLAO|nr:nicotinamide riboside transporter PnuC [Flavobacterium noncentrifugens]GEP49687.1 nicotinamide mononucleotide transporter [Flavobacterium noncentrifugens]SDJ24010.1 nicotinamide mononucleotide transporter [Flavobacterium noncentrifugens]
MIEFFTEAYKNTPWIVIILEAITFVFGIASVYYAKQENILVYPTGLIATTITVYLLYRAGYFGDMVINIYYSVMSIYGWYKWSIKKENTNAVAISRTSTHEKLTGFGMFLLTIIVIFAVYKAFGYEIKTENYLDIFTSGLFFTAMWYMAFKKIENWTLWIIGDLIAVPIYAYRGLGILSLEYIVFTILAILAYIEWRKILSNSPQTS